ncbi:Ku protein [Streptomyces sp. TN58]|uniref:non-homologous end joining protein Ku n=1 Tax=Streptomyces sp. TN58 TaxID=234612 RepID=UPI0009507DB0|nr:Ku protein [Streptomyces sp. TN58]APU44710.1 Ku protein [Streptomyces sp. TN58]
MARPVWTGVLSFGLVSVPIGIYTATDSHTIHFHQLQRGTSDRIRNRRVNERTGEEVDLDDIVKGYDTGEEYVLVEPAELDDIAPGRSKTLEISGFVDLAEIDPIFFDRTYYVGPKGKEYSKVYALLEKALAKAERAGVATFVMRGREYLVALKAEDGILTLHTLHWADEIRDPREEVPDLPAASGRGTGSSREMKMAEQLITALGMRWDPEEFRDTYQDKVSALIKAKGAGETVEKAEAAAEATNVVDLTEALRASVERARGGGRRAGGGGRRKSAASGKPLDSLTKAELYERATAAGIPGRSTMTRAELAEALTSSDSEAA